MVRIALLGTLLFGAAALLIAVNSSATEESQTKPMDQWDMRQEIQDASDTERNGWRREMDI